MTLLTTIALVLITSITSTLQLTNEQKISVLQEANIAYDNGIALQTADRVASKEAFRKSAERFQILIDDGIENGKLFYNLGNAYLQSGEIGEAIAAYRSAQRYLPSDGRVKPNLDYARSLVISPIKGETHTSILKRLAFWHDAIPTQVRLAFCIFLWFICWGLVTARLFRSLPMFKTASITLGFATIALGISVVVDRMNQHQDHGVLTANEVIVRKGKGASYAPILNDPLYEGIEFEVIEQRPDWLHIKFPNGSTGWIKKDDAQIVSLVQHLFRL